MTDRELLELAAKAAGAFAALGEWLDGTEPYSSGVGFVAGDRVWNPLTDDGDALRLAVKLQMDIVQEFDWVQALGWINENHPNPASATEDSVKDPYAATRRAIVRAAAEIGRATP